MGLYDIMTVKLLKIVKHYRIPLVAQLAKNLPVMWESWVRSLDSIMKIPWRREMATCSSILAWRITWIEEPCEL